MTEQKTTILLAALDERYKSLHAIRERVQSIGVWSLGLLIAAGSWFLQSDNLLYPFQAMLYILGVVAAFAVLRFRYLEDLHKGFKSQQKVAVRLEKALGFFTPGALDDEAEPVYPKKWGEAGIESGEGHFFLTTYALLYVGVAFLIGSIVLSTCWWY